MRKNTFKATLKVTVLAAGMFLVGTVMAFGAQTINLTAGPTTLTLPDGSTVPMWGYSCGTVESSSATCARLNPAATGWSPVVITVPTGQGLQINLTNNLSFGATSIPTSIVIVGQLGGGLGTAATTVPGPDHSNLPSNNTSWPIAGGPGFTPPTQGNRVQSFATEVAAAGAALTPGEVASGSPLTWSSLRPGTYLLESGTHPSIQVPMGLYGILVVTTPPQGSLTTYTAYPGVTYNADVDMLLSEIDPVQNNAVQAAVTTAGFSETAVWTRLAAGGPVTVISVTNGGSGYTLPPTVTINGAGSGATAVATLTGGIVTSITVTNAGDGYSAAAGATTVTITPAAGDTTGTGATAAATVVQGGCGGGAHTCYPPAVNYTPLYYLVNGVAFNKTNAFASLFHTSPPTGVNPITGKVLVRFVNAGLRMHMPSIVGAQTGTTARVPGFSLIAEDGNPLPGAPRVQSEVFMAAGKTYDVMVNTPVGPTALSPPPSLPVFDRELSLSGNATERDAGMLAYISVNYAALPAAPALGAAQANPDTYSSVIAGQPLTVSDPSKGVIANDVNIYGVKLTGTPVGGSVTLNTNGTFTFSPTAASGSFQYCGNGATSGPACTTVALGAAPIEGKGGIVMNPITYTASTATYLSIAPPGPLAVDKDNAGYPLTVVTPIASASSGVTVTMQPNGGFSATADGTGPVTCPTGAPASSKCYNFTYTAKNSQGSVSDPATVTLVYPQATGLNVVVLDGNDKKTTISDYRWIIEEDRTFYVNPQCTNNPLPGDCPKINTAGTPPSFGTNFHTSWMPVVATGCTGPLSCESGQTVLGVQAVCDVGNGICDTTRTQQTQVYPSQVYLDPTKRYYLSVLPGDAANPFEGGAVGHGMGGAPIACVLGPGETTCTSGDHFPNPITVLSQPTPYPPSKLSVVVFEDDFPLNGEQDNGGGIDVLSPNEPGLGGFNIELFDDAGGTGDATGQMTYDMFNQPLTNSLAGQIDPSTGLDACPLSAQATANPAQQGIVGQITTCPKFESDGKTLSPIAGQAVVANLMPGRFGVVATPGADRVARGEEWLQTNTLDGQKAHDSFLRIGEPAYFQEFGPAGYHVAIGFANPRIINDRHDAVCSGAFGAVGACNNTIDGRVTGIRMSRTPDERLYSSGSRDTFSFTQCYVSLGDPDEEDFMFTKCNADGTFSFSNVPGGSWRLSIFDQWNDQIVDGLSTPTSVSGGTTLHMGDIGVQQWQANIYTQTYFDQNGNGVRDSNEQGLALVSTNIRFRDGSFSNFNNTDLSGNAGFNEVFPLFNWYVVETTTTRYKNTGTHVVYDAGGPADGSSSCGTGGNAMCGSSTAYNFMANTYEQNPLPGPADGGPNLSVPGAVYCSEGADCGSSSIANGPVPSSTSNHSTGRIDPPWVLTEAWQGFSGQNSFLEFGKKPFNVGENGGIQGHVAYASTRPFDDPQLLLQTSWEPLVPHVSINLYQEGTAPDGSKSLKLVDTTQTSSWDDWAQGFRSSDGVPNMNCPGQFPAPTTSAYGDIFFFTLQDQPEYLNWYNAQHGVGSVMALPNHSQFKCYDGMHNWNQLQPAPYDGFYQFPSVVNRDPSTGKPTGAGMLNGAPTLMAGTNCAICVSNPSSSNPADPTYDPYNAGLPMLPAGKYVVEVVVPPGYELVKEEDKNILIGDNYIAPVTQQFGGLGNIFILPDQAEVASQYNANNAQNSTQNLGRAENLPSHEGDTGSVESFWPCVGASRTVPDYISLFPGSKEVSPFAGATRNLCDRKEITLEDQASALAKFYIFTSTHAAAHFTGVITDDFTSEFDPFAPAFGEKFAPPNMPVSLKDYAGNETSRVYADHFGLFDGLNFSTWEVNPPNPTGYSPTMMVTCMNDAGPIVDPRTTIFDVGGNPMANPTFGQTIGDPLFNSTYSQFCYELPFMPGQTQYMDTPVVPTSAFAGAYNHPDCNYPDATPAIASVIGSDGVAGPWLSAGGTGHTITITALGDQMVEDNAYSGPSAKAAPFNQKKIKRHYGFGPAPAGGCSNGVATAACPNVTVGGIPLHGVTWTDATITGTVQANVPVCSMKQQVQYGAPTTAARCGELAITAVNGKVSVDTVTVTIGGKNPTVLAAGQTIQSAIDAAAPGDMIIVPPGTYNEMVIMWKPVRLQGVGAVSSIINANTHPSGQVLEPWRRAINCLFGLAINGTPYTSGTGTNPYDPSGHFSCPGTGWTNFTAQPNAPQVDRLPLEAVVGWDASLNGNLAELLQEPSLMGAYEGAGITVLSKGVDYHGAVPWNDGNEAGAFPIGTTLLTSSNCGPAAGPNPFPSNFQCNPSGIDGLGISNSSQGGGGIFVHGWAHNLEISNNRVYNNTGTLSGGISVGQGEFAPANLQGSATAGAPGSCQTSTITNQELPYCLDLNTNVHNNSVTYNSSIGDELFSATLSGGGGVTFCTGTDYYKFNYNWVCGNLSSGEGGGVVHLGFIYNGDIEHNAILFNQSINPTIPTNGGGLMVQGTPDTDPVCGTQPDADCPPGLSDGTGPNLVINANLIQGNSADSGSGGGVRLQGVNGSEVSTFPSRPDLWYGVNFTNNIIVDNVAGWDGAGVSLQDALKVNLSNNTIAHNDTTASSGVLNTSLGAPLSSSPAGNCTQAGPSGPQTASCPQPAGLVSMGNTGLLTTTFTGLTITCPAGNPNCTGFSNPVLANDLLWQNRAFQIGVGIAGTGTQNQQNMVALYNASFNRTSVGPATVSQTSTGSCNDPGASYWEIGVRGDTGPTNHSSGFTLAPTWSVLTDATDYPGANNLGSNPTVVAQYCNGARVPPECTVANGCVSGAGWAVPPGIADAVVPNPVFSLTPAATVDEGNNWINVTWGPLELTNDAVMGGAYGDYGGGAPLGNYALAAGSPAIDYIPVAQPHVSTDFFGNPRPDPSSPTGFDVGAVEFQGAGVSAPVLSTIAPNSGGRNTSVPVTLTGTNLSGVTAVNVSGTGVTVSAVNVVNPTTVTATFTISGTAGLTARNVTVVSAGGTSNAVTFTVAAPTVTGVSPNTGLRGTAVPVTITGTGLGSATGVTVSGTGVTVSNFTRVNATTVTATFTVAITAGTTARTVTVQTPSGNAARAAAFTVVAPTLTSIAPNIGHRGTSVGVTLTGTNLAGTTSIVVSGTGVTVSNLSVVNSTTVTATFNITTTAALTVRNVHTVSTTNGNSNNVAFTVQP